MSLTQSQHDDLCAILSPAFETHESGGELLVAIDRMHDDGHPLAEFLRAWYAKPAQPGRRGWVIGSGRLGDRVTVRLSSVEAGSVECELMVESPDHRNVQVWLADIPVEIASELAAMWPDSERRDAIQRVERLPAGNWRDHARMVGQAVLA